MPTVGAVNVSEPHTAECTWRGARRDSAAPPSPMSDSVAVAVKGSLPDGYACPHVWLSESAINECWYRVFCNSRFDGGKKKKRRGR